jgi:protein required for attachment to host cells
VLSKKFEDTKGVIRSRKLKDRQNQGQKKKDNRTNNDLQNITQETKDRAKRTYCSYIHNENKLTSNKSCR